MITVAAATAVTVEGGVAMAKAVVDRLAGKAEARVQTQAPRMVRAVAMQPLAVAKASAVLQTAATAAVLTVRGDLAATPMAKSSAVRENVMAARVMVVRVAAASNQ